MMIEVCEWEARILSADDSGGALAPVPQNVGDDTGDRNGRANRGSGSRADHPAPVSSFLVDTDDLAMTVPGQRAVSVLLASRSDKAALQTRLETAVAAAGGAARPPARAQG